MNEPRELKLIQRWMQAVIMHPGGVTAGINSTQAQSEIGVTSNEIERLVERSRNLSSIERLEVYGNAYHARLLECLRDEFPGLVHAAGEEAFDALAFGYLQSYPSQSYTLSNLAHFPRYLRRPVGRDGNRQRASWPDFRSTRDARITYSEVLTVPASKANDFCRPKTCWPFRGKLADAAANRRLPAAASPAFSRAYLRDRREDRRTSEIPNRARHASPSAAAISAAGDFRRGTSAARIVARRYRGDAIARLSELLKPQTSASTTLPRAQNGSPTGRRGDFSDGSITRNRRVTTCRMLNDE
jgi:hypothetical protein